jgi:(S)-3,5-dihydroxyphenylglycine transaminase
VGFAVADQIVVDRDGTEGLLVDEITKLKSMVTVNTSALGQAVVGGMLLAADGRTADINVDTSRYYGDAMQAILRELEAAFPEPERAKLGLRWNQPTGGFFLTMDVPFRADDSALERSAEEHGVIWTPMSYFYPQGGGANSIRLSISYLTPSEISDGVKRLAGFIKGEIAARTPLRPTRKPTSC